jgi:hypothetical protein
MVVIAVIKYLFLPACHIVWNTPLPIVFFHFSQTAQAARNLIFIFFFAALPTDPFLMVT